MLHPPCFLCRFGGGRYVKTQLSLYLFYYADDMFRPLWAILRSLDHCFVGPLTLVEGISQSLPFRKLENSQIIRCVGVTCDSNRGNLEVPVHSIYETHTPIYCSFVDKYSDGQT